MPVRAERRRSQHLGQGAVRPAPSVLELPEPVLGHHEPEAGVGVFLGLGEDVRDAVAVADDLDRPTRPGRRGCRRCGAAVRQARGGSGGGGPGQRGRGRPRSRQATGRSAAPRPRRSVAPTALAPRRRVVRAGHGLPEFRPCDHHVPVPLPVGQRRRAGLGFTVAAARRLLLGGHRRSGALSNSAGTIASTWSTEHDISGHGVCVIVRPVQRSEIMTRPESLSSIDSYAEILTHTSPAARKRRSTEHRC